jgi:indolepyruvate ferredoxin oxidoreductase
VTDLHKTGIDAQNFTLSQRDYLTDADILLTGVQAAARLVSDQLRADHARGLRTAAFVSGYPGSPLAGFDQALRKIDKRGLEITHVDGLNEDLAATAVWGSQQDHLAPLATHDGVIGVWYGKAPGLDRSGDALRHANLHGAGRNGGVILLVGDDPASKSSTMPSASEFSLIDLGIPVLYPGTIQEVLDYGRFGFELSRSTGLYAALKIVTTVADGFGVARVASRWHPRTPTKWTFFGQPWSFKQRARFFIPDTLELETELHSFRLPAAAEFLRENRVNAIINGSEPAKIGIVAAGRTYFELREALRQLGFSDLELAHRGIRILKVGALYPWDSETCAEFSRGIDTILVVEEKRPLLERYIRDQFYDSDQRPRILGKNDENGSPLFPSDGELTADRIRPLLQRELGKLIELPVARELIPLADAGVRVAASSRTSYFCSGCPHNRSTLDHNFSPVGGGVGCHALVMWMDRGATSYTHMGGEGAQWIGRAPFTDTPHFIQNIGDGTYFHSGSLVPRYAVAAGANITFRILYNGVIAMTGGQMPAGQQTIPELCRSLRAEGVARIVVVTDELGRYTPEVRRQLPVDVQVRDRSDAPDVERELAAIRGVTILIYDQACSNELRRLRKRDVVPERKKRVVINEAVCEGCGDCGVKSTCLSVQPVESLLGRKTQIHQGSCNTDYSCLDGECPSFVTVEVDRAPSRSTASSTVAVPNLPLPDEYPPIPTDGFGIYTVGVGGTGLVTLNQILATAAAFDGLYVTGLDQTGLSQKGGPVVSHLKLFREPVVTSQSLGEQTVDTFIALDLLVANDPRHRSRLSPRRTRAILSTSRVPTAEMVLKTDSSFGSVEELTDSVGRCVRPDMQDRADILAIAEGIFKDHMTVNIIALGMTFQKGFLPVSEPSLRRAIEVNGAAVERSKKAFAIGRLAVADPQALKALMPEHRPGSMNPSPSPRARERAANLMRQYSVLGSGDDIGEFVELLTAELIDYQGSRLAGRYCKTIAELAERESAELGAPGSVTRTAALHLFRLAAVKDEYEVARLHRKPQFRAELARLVPGATRQRFLLQPPFLTAIGLKSKIAVPSALAGVMFTLLAALRRIRSTPLDVFSFAKIRREERRLLDLYRSDLELVRTLLTAENYCECEQLLGLPGLVRGFESVKRASIRKYYESRERSLASLNKN